MGLLKDLPWPQVSRQYSFIVSILENRKMLQFRRSFTTDKLREVLYLWPSLSLSRLTDGEYFSMNSNSYHLWVRIPAKSRNAVQKGGE